MPLLRPQDVFVRFVDFKVWLLEISEWSKMGFVRDTWGERTAMYVWDENLPCVPGSYGIVIH